MKMALILSSLLVIAVYAEDTATCIVPGVCQGSVGTFVSYTCSDGTLSVTTYTDAEDCSGEGTTVETANSGCVVCEDYVSFTQTVYGDAECAGDITTPALTTGYPTNVCYVGFMATCAEVKYTMSSTTCEGDATYTLPLSEGYCNEVTFETSGITVTSYSKITDLECYISLGSASASPSVSPTVSPTVSTTVSPSVSPSVSPTVSSNDTGNSVSRMGASFELVVVAVFFVIVYS